MMQRNQRDRSAVLKREADRHDKVNLEIAEEFLAHPEQYGGTESFGVQVWAPEVIRRLRTERNVER
jgi:hypothetical protein